MKAYMASPIEAYTASPIEAYPASPAEAGPRARYKINLDAGYLRAQLHNRGTVEEMQMFLDTVARTGKVLACGRFLISVDASIPMSMLEQSAFLAQLNELGVRPAHKVAVLGHAQHPGTADDCVEAFARQPGMNVRGFADEAAALQWVRNRREEQDRRHGQTPRLDQPLRLGQDRRNGQVNEWTI